MLHGTTSNMLLDVIWSIRQVILSEKKQNCLQMSCSWYAGVHKFFGRISWIELIFLQLLLCYLCYLPSQSCLRCTVSEPWPVDWSNLWRTEKCRCWSVSRLALKPLGFFSLIKVEVKVENCPVSFQELGQVTPSISTISFFVVGPGTSEHYWVECGRIESSFSALLMLLHEVVFPITRYLITTCVFEQLWLLRSKWDYFVLADALQPRPRTLPIIYSISSCCLLGERVDLQKWGLMLLLS